MFSLAKWAGILAFRTPLARLIGARYFFNFLPAQLFYLCQCIDQTRDVPGCIVEAGCGAGNSTLFFDRHMTATGNEKPYVAIDTFSGFLAADVDVEVERGKSRRDFSGFSFNDRLWFDTAMRRAGATRVRSIRADVGAFDFGSIAPIAFCLLDVDLYRPTSRALPRIWNALSPGGILVVDDCFDNQVFDGANQAYAEFCAQLEREPQRVHQKLGILRK